MLLDGVYDHHQRLGNHSMLIDLAIEIASISMTVFVYFIFCSFIQVVRAYHRHTNICCFFSMLGIKVTNLYLTNNE